MKHGNQTKLAKKIGYKRPAAISLIYSGRRRPSLLFAKRLAQETATSISFWLDIDTPLEDIQKILTGWNDK
jgi:transcriptional regulator with XRE-family HTH domain